MKKLATLIFITSIILSGCVTTGQNKGLNAGQTFEDSYDNIIQFNSDNAYKPELTAKALDLFFKSHPAVTRIEYEVPGEVISAVNPYHNTKSADSFVLLNGEGKTFAPSDLLFKALETYKELFVIEAEFYEGSAGRYEVDQFTLFGGEITPQSLARVDKINNNTIDIIEFGSLKVGEIVLVNDPSISKYVFTYYIPESTGDTMKTVLWGTAFNVLYDKLVDTKLSEFSHKVSFAEDYGYASIQVIIPMSAQYMASETMISGEINSRWSERPDLEYVKVINAFMDKAKSEGRDVHERVYMTGFSNGGIQSNIFPIMHPEMVEATAIGAAGIYLYPTNEDMDWPMGLANADEIEGFSFDMDEFREVEHFIFVGENDNKAINDPVSDGLYKSKFGAVSCDRVPIYSDYLESIGVDSEYIIYKRTGHEFTNSHIRDIFSFFDTIEVQ